MKKYFNRVILSISLIFILMLSLGLVSASNNSDNFIDMTYDDTAIAGNNEISDYDFGSANDLNSCNKAGSGCVLTQDSQSSELSLSSTSNLDISTNEEMLGSNGKDFKDIQNLIDQSSENDTILLSGTFSGDSKIVLNKTLSIEGASSGATLDGKFLTQILEINASNAVIRNIRFVNSSGISVNIGGKNVTLDNCSFENSINGELGSALSCFGDDVKVLNSRFLNNIANKSSCHHTDGPAIYLIASNALIDNCTFINNTGYNYETASSGGAIWMKGSDNSILNSVFINNSAISKFAWTLHGEEQTFLAEGYGGAVYLVGSRGRIDNCRFENCMAHTYGGALYFKASSNCSINNSSFINNYAVGDAGAIYLGQNVYNLEISNSRFENNVALGLIGVIMQHNAYGGAIFASKFVENMSVSNTSFLNNYGNSTIYYLGSNIQISSSMLERSVSIIENETLNQFLKTVKDSTLEECTLEINNFSLYSSSGSLYEALIFTNGSIENNYWGANLYSADDFLEMKLIKSNGEYIYPAFWINLKVVNASDSNKEHEESNKTMSRDKSAIASSDMTTTSVYSKDGKIGKYFSFRLTDSNSKALANKQIIINFNGKTYYKTTDKNGYVKLQINLAKKGTYDIVACFLGDGNYDASFKSSRIKVTSVKAKLKVTSKTYKRSYTKKTLTAKLLSPKGKAVTGKKISFKVNGKTYAAKTNSKGIATVKVKLNKKKTYKFTAKFRGDDTFKSVVAKGKVVVK